ncbi:hypothetical protein CHKEEEPN_4278 [Methylorubrum podarium]|nr:hypothetical protein CHKEEEPN_4278 [Methylorubrum podarium]
MNETRPLGPEPMPDDVLGGAAQERRPRLGPEYGQDP